MKRRLLPILTCLLLVAAPTAEARLGETMSELRHRFGRPEPEAVPQKNVSSWSIETDVSERLIYTVTFNNDGRSIAEGLKTFKRAKMTDAMALAFINRQLEGRADPATTLQPKPGEKYVFAQQVFSCAATEAVWVDETNDFMIIWQKGPKGLVLAVRAEMLKPAP